MEFPIFKTKVEGVTKKFDLSNPSERKEYFELKAGKEIEKLREYLKTNTFIAYLLGKKNSGKGTYSKMFAEAVAPDKVLHFSIGDMIRRVDEELQDKGKEEELLEFLKGNYRGWISIDEIMSMLKERSTKTLLPTELILALVKREVASERGKALFIDGFPRGLDQINFALFFRDLVDYRQDPDVFILLSVPEAVIDERIKWRRVCPQCQTSRNLKLLPTSKIDYDLNKKEFYLLCDNPDCSQSKMVQKEGDEAGIKPIGDRLKKDEELIKQAFSLHGVPKVLLRNSIPKDKAKEFVDDYEITPEYTYSWSEKDKKVKVIEKPWIIPDDQGQDSLSLLAAPVVVALIKQMVEVLKL